MPSISQLATATLACAVLSHTHTLAAAQDPADSWLVYAIAPGPGSGSRVTSVNATWTVPSYPTTRGGGNAPGWWFGIEPRPADILLQPILAYGDGVPEYQIFNGIFNWLNGQWYQSSTKNVKPGDNITASITYVPSSDSYMLAIAVGMAPPIVTPVSAFSPSPTFTDVYFVVEHQPNSCSEYPSDGFIIFREISIAWDGVVQKPQWAVHQFQPACNSQGQILDAATLKFTWDTQ